MEDVFKNIQTEIDRFHNPKFLEIIDDLIKNSQLTQEEKNQLDILRHACLNLCERYTTSLTIQLSQFELILNSKIEK